MFTKKILLFQVGVGLSSAGIHSFEEDNNLIGGLASSDHLCEPPDDGGGGGAGGRVRFVNSTVRYHMASGAAQTLWTGRTSLEKILMVRVHQIVSPIWFTNFFSTNFYQFDYIVEKKGNKLLTGPKKIFSSVCYLVEKEIRTNISFSSSNNQF